MKFLMFRIPISLLVICFTFLAGGCGGSNHFVANDPAGVYRGTFFGDEPMVVVINPDRTVYVLATGNDGRLEAVGSGHLTLDNTYAAYVSVYNGPFNEARGTIDGSGAQRETYGTFVFQDRSWSFYAPYSQAPNMNALVGHYTGEERSNLTGNISPIEGDVDSSGNFVGTLTVSGAPAAVTGKVTASGGFDLSVTQNAKVENFVGVIDSAAANGTEGWGNALSNSYYLHLVKAVVEP